MLWLFASCASTEATDTSSETTTEVESETVSGQTGGSDAFWVARLADAPDYAVTVLGVTGTAAHEGHSVSVVTARGSLSEMGACDDIPTQDVQRRTGMPEVRLVAPGLCCAGVCSDVAVDEGGPATQAAFAAMVAFARGEGETVSGERLPDLLGVPTSPEWLLMVSSGGGYLALPSLAVDGALDGLAGVTVYESPVQPETITSQLGSRGADPDDSVDADGNGFTWDDARNPRYVEGDCDGFRCELDLTQLAYSAEMFLHDAEGVVYRGGFFLDGDGNGKVSQRDGTLDLDEDGALGVDEDFLLKGQLVQGDGEPTWVLTPSVLEAALELVDELPAHIADREATDRHWSGRSPGAGVESALDELPDVPWLILANTDDHAQAVATRPHVVELYEAIRSGGGRVKLNPERDALAAWATDVPDTYAPGAWDQPIDSETVLDHLVPTSLDRNNTRAAGVSELFDLAFGG